MDAKTFFQKVALMRKAQKEYFKTRNQIALRNSKALETEIDEINDCRNSRMNDNALNNTTPMKKQNSLV